MTELPELWQHQKNAIELGKKQPDMALLFDMGCLARDSLITISRFSTTRKYTIEEAYRLYNKTELAPDQKGWNKDTLKDTYIRSWVGDRFGLHKIKAIVRSGEKEVYRLTCSPRYHPLKLTKDHEVFTQRGWVNAGDLIVGEDLVAYDTTTKHTRKEVKKAKIKPRYFCKSVGEFHKYRNKNGTVPVHRLIYEAHINKISLGELIKKTYKPHSLKLFCPKQFHVHHKDHNTVNNGIENLELISAKDHAKMHGIIHSYKNFGHGEMSWHTVRKFEYVGKEMTYDIICEDPYRNFVANNMLVHNCGKTRTALEILRYRMNENKKILRTLIIGPSAVLYNWKNEIEKYTKIPLNKVFVLDQTLSQRTNLYLKCPSDSIFITNFEAFANLTFAREVMAKPPEFLILDESHRVKGIAAQRTKALIKISDQMANHKSHYRMILTGTPVLNSEMDLFSQYRILDGGKRLGTNYFQFRANYFEDKNRFMPKHAHFPKWVPKASTREKLKSLISEISIHATKSECLDLPPLVRVSVPVLMSDEQKKAYEDMKKEFLVFVESGVSVAQLAITKALRMQQILSGFLKLEDGTIHRFVKNPRASALNDLIEDIAPNHKVIVWSIFHEDHEVVKKACQGAKVQYAELTGLVSDKQKEIDRFQNDENCRVMIASQAAGGTGVNLTAASYMIYFSRGYSLEHDMQSEARAYRGGSERHASITRIDLIAENTIDVAVLKALQGKKDLSMDILALAKSL